MSERRALFLDLVGGAAGDMILSALVDAGAPIEGVRAAIDAMGLTHVTLQENEVHPAGLRAKQIEVYIDGVLGDSHAVEGAPHIHTADRTSDPHDAHHHHHHPPHFDPGPTRAKGDAAVAQNADGPATTVRHGAVPTPPVASAHHDHAHHRPYRDIKKQITKAELDERAKSIALDAFRRLAEAESEAHGVPIDEVEFHEVGADDAIADIVGAATAFAALAVDEVIVSPAPLGRGLTRGAHGPIPLPGPATLHLLRGCPTTETSLKGETVTPTGAALLTALADRWGSIPSMTITAVGVGAGHKSWPDRPNIVRALVGTARVAATTTQEDLVVEANIDDMSPEHFAPLEAALFAAGAYDVWTTTAFMKKGRAGVTVHALVRRSEQDAIVEAFLEHSTTLGVRAYEVQRHLAPRTVKSVDTPYGAVRVKVSPRRGLPLVAPEYDDVARLAAEHGVAVRVVHTAAISAALADE
ncbi:MAG: LarC family nickel insertion protein [Deltaproteobacteria bacterium]